MKANFVETISDTTWHHTQTFEHLADGSLRFVCSVDGLDEIVWWILGMGAHCRVIKPSELIERVREEAARMGNLYCVELAANASSDPMAADLATQ